MAKTSDKIQSNALASTSKDSNNLNIIQEDLYTLLGSSTKSSVVQEVKQLINEQYNEVKEPWLVYGLYDTFCSTKSSKFLALLLDCRKDPHDRFLCDKICEELKHKEKRANAFEVLGYVIRKQPSWLYNIPQHSVMKQWIRVLKTEEDMVVMLSGVLNLLAFLPTVPGNISSHLDDVFSIFSRLANWRYHLLKFRNIPEIQQIHLEVTLYAYFHRVYGMFPCNFLSYLRTHFSKEVSKESKDVYLHVIRPIMSTVKMHPLLVTNTRDHEKSSDRWKRMEVHDIVVESSRISLLSQESAKEEELEYGEFLDSHDTPHSSPFINFSLPPISVGDKLQNVPQITSVTSTYSAVTNTGNKASGNLTFGVTTINKSTTLSKGNAVESPPEPAIEATPETTPYVTPLKDDIFRFARPIPSNQVSRQLNLDVTSSARSPTLATRNSIHETDGATVSSSVKNDFLLAQNSNIITLRHDSSNMPATTPTSPMKDNLSFRYPELSHFRARTSSSKLASEYERRDSLFDRMDISNRLSDLPTSQVDSTSDEKIIRSSDRETQVSTTTSNTPTSNQTTESNLEKLQSEKTSHYTIESLLNKSSPEELSTQNSKLNIIQKEIQSPAQYRPSPVKFTNQRPEQFPVKPKPERIHTSSQAQGTKQSTNIDKAQNEQSEMTDNQKQVLSFENLKDFTDFEKEEVSASFEIMFVRCASLTNLKILSSITKLTLPII